jgi:hypothetical protein
VEVGVDVELGDMTYLYCKTLTALN